MTFSKMIWSSCVALAAAVIAVAPALASTGFEGHCSVQISSSRPNCPSGASFAIAIEKGQVASAGGLFNTAARARVGDGGNSSVAMSSGLKRATGLGRLCGASGLGSWHGTLCSGSWTARRD